MPRDVLFVHYVPQRAGSGTSLFTLLKLLDRNRYRPRVVQTHAIKGEVMEWFRALDIPVDHIPCPLIWDKPYYDENNLRSPAWKAFHQHKRLARYFERVKPDIVHLNDFPPVAAGITADEMGLPVVWHSRVVLRSLRRVVEPGRRILARMVRHARRIVAISESEAAQFPAGAATVIYNPVEVDRIRAMSFAPGALRASLGIGEADFVVLAPIMLSADKGAWDYLEACAAAKRLAPGRRMRFLLAGHIPTAGRRHLLRKWTGFLGPESDLDRAYRVASEGGIGRELKLLGFRKDIYDLMNASDLIVFPSHLKACGRPCFEAGVLGKPVIVTLPGKSTKVVLDGETGVVTPEERPDLLGREIARLAADPDECRRLGANAYDYVGARFDAQRHAEEVMALYDSVVATDRAREGASEQQR